MRIVDSRRMTGSNLYTRDSGVVIDLALDPGDPDPQTFAAAWQRTMERVLPWRGDYFTRAYRGGIALFVTGPLDVLMPLTELNEWAVDAAAAELAGGEPRRLHPGILEDIAAARVPGLDALIVAAREHDLPLLVDDEAITLGTGPTQLRFPRQGPLPAPSAIDWSALRRIPIGIVTGTNGKTTTTRLVARMARAAGLVPGITSSDGVAVDERFVQRGDFSGPEGTRIVLRDPAVEIAILETARGGILRRGLTVERCDAALITNVSGDHLGDYGVDDVATMARVKGVVGRDARTVILNAGDPPLVAIAPAFGDRVVWFGPGAEWTVRDGALVHGDRALLDIADIPITFGGRAAYNVENALAAAALAHALGLPESAIVEGLRSFTSTREDNPGRGNLVEKAGVRVLLDFGHNPIAIRSVMALARSLLDERGALRVTIGMPGDRLDDELREVATEIAAGAPAQVVVRELSADLLRGRAPGDVPARLVDGLRSVRDVSIADSELEAVQRLLAGARPGDLVLVLTHLDPAVDALLA